MTDGIPHPLRGVILRPDGTIAKHVGEFAFATDEPRYDETVYTLHETIVPNPRTGDTLGLQFALRPGWIMCTFQIPGGGPDDVGMVFLRGMVAPPDGTRFTLRMLRPEITSRGGSNGPETTENEGGEGEKDPQGDARVQGGQSQVVERDQGDEPEAGHRDRARRERPEPAEAEKTVRLAYPELRSVLWQ